MHQRQPRHLSSGAALASVFACVAILALAPRAAHAQGQCPTEFQEQTSGVVADGGTVCANAVGNKCTFQLELCVNQPAASCTAQDLKTKKIRASSPTFCAGGIGKVNLKANGMSSVCGTFVGVTVKAKKHGTKARSCKIRGKAKKAKTSITLLCQPSSSPCSTTTTTTTSTTLVCVTTTTLPTCGNGVKDAGEQCDPPCGAGCTAGQFCNSSCQCVATAACACGTSTMLDFTTDVGTGSCGAVTNDSGGNLACLTCAGLYFGGGGVAVPLPATVPNLGSSRTKVSACSDTCLTLANFTSTETGSNRNCTSVGCLFGPPLPIPNTAAAALSTCIINVVAADAQGFAQCDTGASSLNLPLTSLTYLFGDLLNGTTPDRPNVDGIQPCPVCLPSAPPSGTCTAAHCCWGGPQHDQPCEPGSGSLGDSYPTSHDCPPPGFPVGTLTGQPIGMLPIAFALNTGISSKTAVASGSEQRVFCGFCRDHDNTGCFEGDPSNGCPHNDPNSTCTAAMAPLPCCTGAGTGTCQKCTGAGVPFPCCTGMGTGTCDPQTLKSCTSNSNCTEGAWPDCEQRNQGAFHQTNAAKVFEVGAPAGSMIDGAAHASTLVSVFCVPPTFQSAIDAAADLPGPGAVSLPGHAQLLP